MKTAKNLFRLCIVVAIISIVATLAMPAVNRVLDGFIEGQLRADAEHIHSIWIIARNDVLTSGSDLPIYPADPRNKTSTDVFQALVAGGYVTVDDLKTLHAKKFQFATVSELDGRDSVLLVSRPNPMGRQKVTVTVGGTVKLGPKTSNPVLP